MLRIPRRVGVSQTRPVLRGGLKDRRIKGDLVNRCADCGGHVAAGFRFADDPGGGLRCRRCALLYRPMLRRSVAIAVVVGTLLVAINQGDMLLAGGWDPAFAWKIPLTYLVPFVVATCGALLNCRVR